MGAVFEEKHVHTLVAFTKPDPVLEDQEEHEVSAIEGPEPMPLEDALEAGSPSLEGKPVVSGLEIPSFQELRKLSQAKAHGRRGAEFGHLGAERSQEKCET